MTETKKWKSRLLSSSLPLEYEIAKTLSNFDFSVSFDYSYFRKDGELKKEFSTDIKGFFLFPLDTEHRVDANLTLLAECKYRDEGKKWVFLPEVNKPEFSAITLGCTIKSLAEFSTVETKKDFIYSFEDKFDCALKGIEISTTNGEVFDKDIRHGLSQLKFALPYLVKENIESNLIGHLVDAKPSFIVSILVTNAELYIFNQDFSIDKMRNIENIDALAKKVPYLICYSEIGPDFTEHHKEIFGDFYSERERNKNLSEFETFQETLKHKKYGIYNSPINTCWELDRAFNSTLRKYYSQHFVCSFEHFETLIGQILRTLSKVTKPKKGN